MYEPPRANAPIQARITLSVLAQVDGEMFHILPKWPLEAMLTINPELPPANECEPGRPSDREAELTRMLDKRSDPVDKESRSCSRGNVCCACGSRSTFSPTGEHGRLRVPASIVALKHFQRSEVEVEGEEATVITPAAHTPSIPRQNAHLYPYDISPAITPTTRSLPVLPMRVQFGAIHMVVSAKVGLGLSFVLQFMAHTVAVDPSKLASVATFVDGSMQLLLMNAALSSVSCGIVTIVAVVSVYSLLHRGLNCRTTKLLISTNAVLYISTCVFFVCNIAAETIENRRTSVVVAALDSSIGTVTFDDLARKANNLYVTMAACLTINIAISDAVVWWRAAAIWCHNRYISVLGGALIVVSAALAAGAITHICPHSAGAQPVKPVSYLAGDITATLSFTISLFTNILATLLMCFLRQYLAGRPIGSRALKSIALLVECGVAYCVIWAIYPMSVIIVFALKQSPLERASAQEHSLVFNVDTHGTEDGRHSDVDNSSRESRPQNSAI
ncbi:uncharacterized protein BXZ73DRAFT_76361 [Epithele typhae]|uniref:uncharacterized protein n=1 Tax=Epithele typhae TaxID=378194 RepID=UPI002008C0A9|nr:uncharacterized protein BXZ73DRAFT_76361 [Epithele typhae]KAH9938860.1 hypothetical protein BXZ73DRAFT_76361 [Epithele typhae]